MHLRRLRQAQSLTLAQLADQVGVTASALSQIERGASEPTLGTLWRLGRALNASLFDFFAGQEAADGRRDPRRRPHRRRVRALPLRGHGPQRAARDRPLHAAARAGRRPGPRPGLARRRGGRHGRRGRRWTSIVAGASYRLGPGDAIWFVSGQPHTFAAVGDEPCLSVWADTIPDHAEPGGSRSVFDGLIAGTGAPGDARTDARAGRPPRADPLRDRARPRHRRAATCAASSSGWPRSGPARSGFRVTGTPEDREAAAFVAERAARHRARRRRDRGGAGRRLALRERAARRRTTAPRSRAPSLGGAPPTPPGGIRARIVDAGGWRRRDLDRLDVRGALVLIDWRKGPGAPTDAGLELGLRGAAGVIVTPAKGGPYFQAEGALGGFDGHWHAGAPPMMTIRMRDGDALRARLAQGPVEATMTVNAAIAPGDRRQQRRRLPAGRRAGPDRRRRPPRRLVPRRVRQRHRRRRPARHRPRAGPRRPPAAPPDLLQLAHRRGVGRCSTARSTGAPARGAR